MPTTAREADKRVTNDITVEAFNRTSTSLSGTAEGLRASLKDIERGIREDQKAIKDYENWLFKINKEKSAIQQRIDANKEWLAKDVGQENGSFEAQYTRLLSDIKLIYGNAKELHGKGIDLLIKEFDYHVTYKRWSDRFTGKPFKPQ